MPSYYAVWQHTVAVYGLGSTKRDAQRDARVWMNLDRRSDTDIETYIGQRLVPRRFYLAPCTERLARAIDNKGGVINVTVIDGQLDFPPLRKPRATRRN